jgi:hypothetical protein
VYRIANGVVLGRISSSQHCCQQANFQQPFIGCGYSWLCRDLWQCQFQRLLILRAGCCKGSPRQEEEDEAAEKGTF